MKRAFQLCPLSHLYNLTRFTGNIKFEQFLSSCFLCLKQCAFFLLLVGYAMVSARWFILELELFKTDKCWYFIFYKWTIISFFKTTT